MLAAPSRVEPPVLVLVTLGFLVLVVGLALALGDRTRGMSCCAPADPTRDLRMRSLDHDHP